MNQLAVDQVFADPVPGASERGLPVPGRDDGHVRRPDRRASWSERTGGTCSRWPRWPPRFIGCCCRRRKLARCPGGRRHRIGERRDPALLEALDGAERPLTRIDDPKEIRVRRSADRADCKKYGTRDVGRRRLPRPHDTRLQLDRDVLVRHRHPGPQDHHPAVSVLPDEPRRVLRRRLHLGRQRGPVVEHAATTRTSGTCRSRSSRFTTCNSRTVCATRASSRSRGTSSASTAPTVRTSTSTSSGRASCRRTAASSGNHMDQPGRVRGTLVLDGETIDGQRRRLPGPNLVGVHAVRPGVGPVRHRWATHGVRR